MPNISPQGYIYGDSPYSTNPFWDDGPGPDVGDYIRSVDGSVETEGDTTTYSITATDQNNIVKDVIDIIVRDVTVPDDYLTAVNVSETDTQQSTSYLMSSTNKAGVVTQIANIVVPKVTDYVTSVTITETVTQQAKTYTFKSTDKSGTETVIGSIVIDNVVLPTDYVTSVTEANGTVTVTKKDGTSNTFTVLKEAVTDVTESNGTVTVEKSDGTSSSFTVGGSVSVSVSSPPQPTATGQSVTNNLNIDNNSVYLQYGQATGDNFNNYNNFTRNTFTFQGYDYIELANSILGLSGSILIKPSEFGKLTINQTTHRGTDIGCGSYGHMVMTNLVNFSLDRIMAMLSTLPTSITDVIGAIDTTLTREANYEDSITYMTLVGGRQENVGTRLTFVPFIRPFTIVTNTGVYNVNFKCGVSSSNVYGTNYIYQTNMNPVKPGFVMVTQ